MKNKKKVIIISVISLMVLIIIGTTYAYFAAQDTETKTRDVRITTDTTDSLMFEIGKDLSITANQETFGSGKGNASDETTAKAILKANSTTNQATDNYYIYIDIKKNNFIYTSEEQTAEVILTITTPDGNLLTTVEGLEYVTVGSVSGFDITESTDLIKVAENKEIRATSANNNTTTEEWLIKITFINLETNQASNGGKEIEASIIMQKEKIGNLFADYIKSQYTSDGVNGLYLFDGEGTYTNADQEVNDGSYRYVGEDYVLSQKAIDAGYEYITSGSIAGYPNELIDLYLNGNKSGITNMQYNNISSWSLHYAPAYDASKQYNTFLEALEVSVADGYLTKDNINNFVCFGSDAEECPEDNLYRIIGVFGNKVKLIKYDYASSELLGEDGDFNRTDNNDVLWIASRSKNPYVSYHYYWNKEGSKEIDGVSYKNLWSISKLNKVNLNTNYLNNIGEKWSSMITGVTYKVGGNTLEAIKQDSVLKAYQSEIINPSNDIEENYKGRVGLMYVSDYGYAIKPENWNLYFASSGIHSTIDNTNWMYMGISDWMITRCVRTNHKMVFGSGSTSIGGGNGGTLSKAIRPVFYLSTGVQYVSGNGTYNNPYRIK